MKWWQKSNSLQSLDTDESRGAGHLESNGCKPRYKQSGSALGSFYILFLFYFFFNSVYFVSPDITNYKFPSAGFTTCTHTTSLTFDLTSDQEKLPRNIFKKTFTREKRWRTLQESNRGGSLSRMDRSNRCHVTRMKRYRVTWTHSMNTTECVNSS